jgi:hypothetical protein
VAAVVVEEDAVAAVVAVAAAVEVDAVAAAAVEDAKSDKFSLSFVLDATRSPMRSSTKRPTIGTVIQVRLCGHVMIFFPYSDLFNGNLSLPPHKIIAAN